MKMKRKISCILLAAIQCALLFSVTLSAQNAESAAESDNQTAVAENAPEDIVHVTEGDKILSENNTREFVVDIPANAVYQFVLSFYPAGDNVKSIDYALTVDGKLPFDGADTLRADCIWENDGEITTLSNHDEVAPEIKYVNAPMEAFAYDVSGIITQPYQLTLSAGRHTVSVKAVNQDFLLYGIKLTAPQASPLYKDYQEQYSFCEKYGGEQIIIEGESAVRKNAYSVSLNSDAESARITPLNPVASSINYIGGDSWNTPGQTLTWEIEVPETGLYQIGASYKQSKIIDGFVYRQLKIDGVTPFQEADELAFGYSAGWQMNTFGNDGEPYLFYLPKGKHTISLAVTLGNVSEVFSRLQEIVANLGDTYLDIVMITGENPDTNRDYELHKQIPDFENNLLRYKNLIDELSADIDTVYHINGEVTGALNNMSRILGNMTSSLYNSHLYISSYYSYYQTLCSWLYDIKNMSLSLDKLVLFAPDSSINDCLPSFFNRMAYSFKRFLYSMANDYSTDSLTDGDAASLKLWVNWGRDQVKVLNTLISKSFSAKTGINVKVEQVNATLVQGVISNNSPDLYLQLSRTEPVNLAMRGIVYDLTQFDDFDEVLTRFQPGAETPYIYRSGVYALPDSQTFNVLFYRKDILDELKIKVPETWDEFLAATAAVQRKNMNTYLPYTKITAADTVNTGVGGLSIFPTMLLQKNGNIYNSEYTETALDSPVSIAVFKYWTDYYSRYSLDADTNFYQRFRIGTIPLGIAPYTQYLTFAASAPEIDGKWEIAEIPGFIGEDGKVSNICAGAGSGCLIMKSSKHKNEAWEFLKWWTSADTQYEYSSKLESVLGQLGRVATSNKEALARLSWDKKSLSVILSQWSKVKEIREIPGSYYVSRSVDQAFWAVYNDTSTPKEAISEWAGVSNKEIKRKTAEYADKKID